MEAGIHFHPWGLTTLRSARQAARTVNRETLSTMATVIGAVVALGAFVRDEIGDVRVDIAHVRTDVAGLKTDVAGLKADVAELKTDVAELRTDVADLKERMVRVEVLLGISRVVVGELTSGHEDSASR